MSSILLRAKRILIGILVLVVTSAIGVAAAFSLDDLASAPLLPSSEPSLLGPIGAGGRNAWDCVPEQAARAERPAAAELPQP